MNPLAGVGHFLERRGSQGDSPAAHPNMPAEESRRSASEDSSEVVSRNPARGVVTRRARFSPYLVLLDAIRRRRFPPYSLAPVLYIRPSETPEVSPTSLVPGNRDIEMRHMASTEDNLTISIQTALFLPFHEDDGRLYVEVNRLAEDPNHYFLLLGKEFLFKGRDVPRIVFYDGDVENPVCDFGGGKRSFIQKLCESLRKDDPIAFDSSRLYLSNGRIPDFDGSNESRECNEILGRIFACCYKQAHHLKTGPMFDEVVYRCLSWFMANNEEDWHLCAYLAIHNLFEETYPILGKIVMAPRLYHAIAVLKEDELIKLRYLCDVNGEFSLSKLDLCDNEKIHQVRSLLIQNSKNDRCVQAIRWIGLGMKEGLESDFVEEIKTVSPDQFKLRVEGRYFLDKEMILKQVKYIKNCGYNLVEDTEPPLKDYFENWLTLCSEEKLRRLVEAITGKKYLGSELLNIMPETKSPNHFPEVSTCFMLLKIPNSYPSQEHFNRMLDEFLERCFEHHGFQTA